MIDNRLNISTNLEPLQLDGAEALWAGRDLMAEPAEPRGRRILLVEDQDSLRACLRMMLELDGHQVTEAGNGAEGLNLFTSDEFDLVVTDFDMPVMDGSKLAIGIKLMAPSLPILMVTASEGARRSADNPVDGLLSKPCTLADLRGALARLLSGRPEAARAAVVPSADSRNSTDGRQSTPLTFAAEATAFQA